MKAIEPHCLNVLVACLLFGLSGCSAGGNSESSDPAPLTQNPPPPVPAPHLVTYKFLGHLGSGGSISGVIIYDPTAPAVAHDVRGLAPNTTWTMTELTMDIHPEWTGIPSAIEWPTPDTTQEFCLGECVFSAPALIRLYMTNGQQQIQLTWIPPTPLTGPPRTIEEWGTPLLDGCYLKSFAQDGTFQVWIGMTGVELNEITS